MLRILKIRTDCGLFNHLEKYLHYYAISLLIVGFLFLVITNKKHIPSIEENQNKFIIKNNIKSSKERLKLFGKSKNQLSDIYLILVVLRNRLNGLTINQGKVSKQMERLILDFKQVGIDLKDQKKDKEKTMVKKLE